MNRLYMVVKKHQRTCDTWYQAKSLVNDWVGCNYDNIESAEKEGQLHQKAIEYSLFNRNKTEQEIRDSITQGIDADNLYVDSETGKTFIGEKQHICKDAIQQLAVIIGRSLGVIE